MKNKNNTIKSGFSILEALVSMLVLSLFFIASSRIITQKHSAEFEDSPHGYYECYFADGKQWEHRSQDSEDREPKEVDKCIFDPPTTANFVNVHYYDGSQCLSSPQIIFNDRLELASPSSIRSKMDTTDDEEMQNAQAQYEEDENSTALSDLNTRRINEFMTYLRLTHPNSQVSQMFESETPPSSAVFIAW